ncbi:hypothetical protein DFH07DRAFT_950440 [Mycena maculata]|uniref:Uncharacterized protein n=1 Tax=Mycena maculata TaxID=230809 RepID=A0AAD7K6S8_9AGAR|nr:hypothetical protein DFH07DRAFT_950440 [Mycena maculata]
MGLLAAVSSSDEEEDSEEVVSVFMGADDASLIAALDGFAMKIPEQMMMSLPDHVESQPWVERLPEIGMWFDPVNQQQ